MRRLLNTFCQTAKPLEPNLFWIQIHNRQLLPVYAAANILVCLPGHGI